MKNFDWLPVSISLVALAFSVFTWWSAQSERERSREREYPEGFLLPFRSVLNINLETHRSLIADTKLKHLEFAPDFVQKELHSEMSEDDPRRIIWRAEISRLMSENRKAIELVERNIGRVESAELRSELENFKKHALDWQAMWSCRNLDEI